MTINSPLTGYVGLAGATITLMDGSGTTITTGSDGGFQISSSAGLIKLMVDPSTSPAGANLQPVFVYVVVPSENVGTTDSMSIIPNDIILLSGQSVNLFLLPLDADNNVVSPPETVTWYSSNTSVCTVDLKGLLTAVGAGTCQVIATGSSEGISTITAQTEVTVSQTPSVLTGTVKDSLGNLLTEGYVTVEGAIAAASIVNGSYTLNNVPPGQIGVTVMYGGTSAFYGQTTVAAGETKTYDITLSTSPKPYMLISPTSVSFESGSASAAVSIKNRGNANLEISTLTLTGNAFSKNVSAPLTILPNSEIQVIVSFDSSKRSVAPATGTLTIQGNDTDNPSVSVPLTGLYSEISISPASITLDSRVPGFKSSQTFTITNNGDRTIAVSSISSNAAQFTVSPTSCTIAAGAFQLVTVSLIPDSLGTYSSTITITSDSDKSTNTVVAIGLGVPPIFSKNATNPVLSGPANEGGIGWGNWVYYPFVFKDGATYRMFFSGWDTTSGQDGICLATSTNPLTTPDSWTKYTIGANPGDGNPFYRPAGENPGKPCYVEGPDGQTVHMYYTNYNVSPYGISHTQSTKTRLAVAYSDWDAPTRVFEKSATASDPDSAYAMYPWVLYDSGTGKFKMWYYAKSSDGDANKRTIMYADSTDGITWGNRTACFSSFSTTYVGSTKEERVNWPCVIKAKGYWHMFYTGIGWHGGYDPGRIFYAVSKNGTTWTKYQPNGVSQCPVPILECTTTGNWDASIYAATVYHDSIGKKFYMWFSADDTVTSDTLGIGVANTTSLGE